MNKEDDAIKKFVSDYKNLLTANKIDVAQSEIENTWFVYRYEKQYGYYDYFIRFSTVAQLPLYQIAPKSYQIAPSS